MKYQRKIIVFLGPQGAGKGTQAELLSKELSLPVIDMGQLIRNKSKENSLEGRLIKEKISKGELVSDKMTIKLLKEEWQKEKMRFGFILDGFPRSLKQVPFLEKQINKNDIFKVIYLEISDQEVIKRLVKRRICSDCGKVFIYQPGLTKCSACGGKLIQRSDDQPEAIKKRLKLYHQLTKSVLDYYRRKGNLIKINGQQSISKVFLDIKKALEVE